MSKRQLSAREAIQILGPEEYARLVREASDRTATEPFEIMRLGKTITFRGPINHDSASALARELGYGETDTLDITSSGGYIEAGIKIGNLVRDHKLHVVVRGYCVSSCANYVFPAGARRTILPGAAVIWHGNAGQKDWREFDQCGREVSSFQGTPFLPDQIKERRDSPESASQRRAAELEFYASVKVDDFIARSGQEPRFHGNFTMTTTDMAKFGLVKIDAEEGYGTKQFCRRFNRQRPSAQLHCISIDDEVLAYERARRAVGEACRGDGTLSIRTSRH